MASYFATTSDADAVAATLPASVLVSYNAATSGDKAKALELASADVDSAMPYQGRKYDPAQSLQFPRVASDATPGTYPSTCGIPGQIWDVDPATNAVVVPAAVKGAVLYQADAILSGTRDARLDNQHDGVAYDQTATLAESYNSSDRPGLSTGLVRRAYQLLQKYRARSGRIL